MCLYDLLWASEGLIGHGTGLVNVNGNSHRPILPQTRADILRVEFRMVVFRPFKGEVMFGKIRSSTPSGINIRTNFFDEIFVPSEELPSNTE